MGIAEQITTNTLAELGVIKEQKPEPSGENSIAKDLEVSSGELWAKYDGSRTKSTRYQPRTQRHGSPRGWTKDDVLAELDEIRTNNIDMSMEQQAVFTRKNFKECVELIATDLLNGVEQGGFVVNGGDSIIILQQRIAAWLVEHTRQYDGKDYRIVVVEG